MGRGEGRDFWGFVVFSRYENKLLFMYALYSDSYYWFSTMLAVFKRKVRLTDIGGGQRQPPHQAAHGGEGGGHGV